MDTFLFRAGSVLKYGIVFLMGAVVGTRLDTFWMGTEANDLRTAAYRLRTEHAEAIAPGALLEHGVRGMVEHLRGFDPYALYMPPAQGRMMAEEVSGEIGGIGVSLRPGDGPIHVLDVFPGSPAERAGLRAGDTIVGVDGIPIAEDERMEAVLGRVKGEPGTRVSLSVLRQGAEALLAFDLERAVIVIPVVAGTRMLDGEVGYLSLRTMSDHAADQVNEALGQLRGMRGLILDLRGNLGGTLGSGIDVADLFLPSGTILEVRPRDPDTAEVFPATPPVSLPVGVPVIILVDEATASSAEIVAGALQDHRRARLVGARTWGKGTVQKVFEANSEGDGARLKFTYAYWYTPSGRRLERRTLGDGTVEGGLTPDLEVAYVPDPADPEKDNVLEEARAVLVRERHGG